MPSLWCHACQTTSQVNAGDLICPRCQSEFVEEVNENSDLMQAMPQFPFDLGNMVGIRMEAHPEPSQQEDGHYIPIPGAAFSITIPVEQLPNGQVGFNFAGMPPIVGQLFGTALGQQGPQVIPLDQGNGGHAMNLLHRLLGLPGNPGDYAWGQQLDDIMTRLQDEATLRNMPPPATEDAIEKLPRIKVDQEIVEKSSPCAICQEEFVLDEIVPQLECKHVFHEECVVPWLKVNGTCPTCRSRVGPEPSANQRGTNPLSGLFEAINGGGNGSGSGSGAENSTIQQPVPQQSTEGGPEIAHPVSPTFQSLAQGLRNMFGGASQATSTAPSTTPSTPTQVRGISILGLSGDGVPNPHTSPIEFQQHVQRMIQQQLQSNASRGVNVGQASTSSTSTNVSRRQNPDGTVTVTTTRTTTIMRPGQPSEVNTEVTTTTEGEPFPSVDLDLD